MLEYRVLGPLEVLRDGEPLTLGKGAERALLALLVLRAGRPLSTDELIEALWGEQPPPTAREMVRNYVGIARRRLGGDAIATTAHGYVLTSADDVDVARFERLLAEGRGADDAGEAADKLERALSLWRGRPLPELDDISSVAGDVHRLAEIHATALEEWFDTQLDLGRAAQIVARLEAFVDEHPYRERPLAQLMLALYRSGRQKEALDRFTVARAKMVDEIGIEPGPAVRDLQTRILRHDRSLDLHLRQPPREAGAAPVARRRRTLLLRSGLVVIAAGVATAFLAWPHPRAVAVPSRGVLELDQRTGKPVGAISLAAQPGPIAAGAGRVSVGSTEAVIEIVPQRRKVTLPRTPYALSAIGDALWVGNGFDGTLIRVDASGNAGAPFKPEPGSRGRLPLATNGIDLWVASQDGTLSELSAAGKRIATVRGTGLPQSIAAGDGSVWIALATEDAVERVDMHVGHRRTKIHLGGRPLLVAAGSDAIWAMTPDASTLWRIDPRTDSVVAPVSLPANATAMAVTRDGVWIGSADGILTRVDPATNTVNGTRALGRTIDSLAVGDGRLWASVG